MANVNHYTVISVTPGVAIMKGFINGSVAITLSLLSSLASGKDEVNAL